VKIPTLIGSSLLGIILFISPLLDGSWDIWAKTIVHLISAVLIILLIISQHPKNLFKKPLIIPLTLFSLILLSTYLSHIPFNSEVELHNWLNYLIIFIAVLLIPQEYLYKILSYFVLIVTLLVFMAYYQVFIAHEAMPDVTLINPNIFAGYLLLAIPLLYYVQKDRPLIQKNLITILIVFAFFALILTKSISSMIAILVAVAITRYRWKGIIGSMVIIAILLIFKLMEPDVANRLLWWKSSIEIIKETPLFGTGIGTFELVYPKFKTGSLHSIFAHSYYLQFASEAGIIGVSIFLSFVVYLFTKIKEKSLKIAFLAILLQNAIDYSLYIPANGILFWFIVAIIIKNISESNNNSNLTRNNVLFIRIIIVFLICVYVNGVLTIYNSTKVYNLGEASYQSGDIISAEKYFIQTKIMKPNFWLSYKYLMKINMNKFAKTKYISYLNEALIESENTKKYNPYHEYYYAKKIN